MKDYLEKRREELSKREEGFTLMEMLIVVAIIAVLIAIAIPVFTSQLENSREATDAANLRSKYAEVAADGMLSDSVSPQSVEAEQTQAGWSNEAIRNGSIGDIAVSSIEAQTNGNNWTVSWDVSNQKVSIGPAASN